ncbi:hypothetical protein B0H11DRAFT_2130883 [Mycena galericulata]|nr:hypothetical protein B0H11DRAFT_2130883 [Mycena galericulata]
MSFPIFTSSTTAEEVATVFADQIRGKNVLITGTSLNGIGFEAARVIAKYANLLIITGYNLERLKLSEDAIKKETPSANTRLLTLDLSSLAAVRKAAAEVNAYAEPIHILIHNAAAPVGPYALSADGIEVQLATDHVGPFLLTKLLLPKLLAAAAATPTFTPRVVFVSSAAHGRGALSLSNMGTLGRPGPEAFSVAGAYAEGKQANVLTAMELSRRAKGKVNAYSLHPGTIFTNVYTREEGKKFFSSVGIITPEGLPNPGKFEWKSLAQGAATTLAAAFDPRLDDKPGAYLQDGAEANDKIAPSCTPDLAAALWSATEGLVGEGWAF